MAVAEHLVGRAEELGSLDQLLAGIEGGRPAGCRTRRRAGHRQDAAPRRARTLAPRAGVISCCPAPPPNSSATCPSESSSDALDEYLQGLEPRSPRRTRRRRPERARERLPFARRARDDTRSGVSTRALPQPPRRPRASRAADRASGRSCSCSTTSTGQTPRRSICSALCSAGLPMQRSSSSSRFGRSRRRERLAPALEPARRAGTLARLELGAADARRGRELLARHRRR